MFYQEYWFLSQGEALNYITHRKGLSQTISGTIFLFNAIMVNIMLYSCSPRLVQSNHGVITCKHRVTVILRKHQPPCLAYNRCLLNVYSENEKRMNELAQTEKKWMNQMDTAPSVLQRPGRVGLQTTTRPPRDTHRNQEGIFKAVEQLDNVYWI